jgi:hypothetical protein
MATRKEITEFDGLCDRLSRNDPETKVVDVNVLIRGCCPRLGDALAHNTNVTQVSFYIPTLLSLDDMSMENAASFHNYLRSNQFLRSVEMTISEAMDSQFVKPTHPFDEDLAIEVFRAIAENPNIQKFRKDVYVWFPPLAWTHLIAGTTSISEMDLGLGLGFPVYDGHGFPVQAFASNQSLVDLEVHGVYDILDPLLFQLHSHPTLRKLTVTFCAITASYLPRMDWRT